MVEFFRKLFETDFMPHVYCLRTPGLIWLHAVSDGLIAFAYFLIPLALLRLVQKRRDLVFHWLFVLFAIFILSCGATHVLGIVTLWVPVYRLDALIKVITAASSLLTAVLLIRLIPTIASYPSLAQWRRSNEELVTLNTNLEKRVEQRTSELKEKNIKLQELTAAWDLAHGFIRGLAGDITFWCAGSQQLYGWEKQEAVGRNPHQLLRTVFPKPEAEISRELEEKGSWSGELVHTAKSGSRLRIATHWVLQRSETGEAIGVIEVNNDITDRLRAEEALQRLADLVESSNDAIIGTSLDGVIDSWNSSAESLFGYSASEMIGESIERLTPVRCLISHGSFASSSGGLTVTEALPHVIGAKRHETVRRTKTGKEIDVSITVSPIRNSAGEVIGTSQIVHDISEAKAREEAFRLSEERQRLAVEAGQIGLWYMDVEDNKCIWTQRSKELHGLGAESEVPDFPAVLMLMHPEDRQAVGAAFSQVMSGNSALAMEYRTTGLDFRTKWLQIRGQAQLDSAGRVRGVHGTLIDLTARKEMEDKLRRANTELEQFAYAAAHDLQEPLRNVALAAALLKVDPADPRHLLVTVIENAHRMEAMVKDLLAYSRALDTHEGQEAKSDGSAVLEKVLHNLALTIAEKQATITSDPIPVVCIQETHLLQVLQNLLTNALKYSGTGEPRIHIGASVRPGDVLIFVKDNGIGIAPQFHGRAFGMFKRLHQGTVKGTGIGLAVCKRIVEHYGGRIWIESEAGEGATFSFTIPSSVIH